MRGQLLDIHTGAEPLARRADDNDAHLVVGAQGVDLGGDGKPAGAVKGVHRRVIEDHLGDAVCDGGVEWLGHNTAPRNFL